MTTRFVSRGRRIHHDSHCLLCGANYGISKGGQRRCARVTCLACGSEQCSVNGLGRGQCSICHVGLLPWWSSTDRQCDYKGCTDKAIACADGQNRHRCRKHMEQGKWKGYIDRQIAERDKRFIAVDDSGTFPTL